MQQLTDKVALVTGGGSGIGRAAVQRFVQEGARVGLLGHTAEKVQQAAEEFQEAGYRVKPLVADVASSSQMEQAAKRLVEEWGRLDIVFANAGINGVWAPIEELTPDEWDQTININLRGTFLTVKYTVPYLKKQGGGSIIITASVNGTRMFSNTGATAYASSKAAQVAFTKMTALELADHKIRVNVICPGYIDTEIEDNTTKEKLERIQEPVEYPEGAVPLTGGGPGQADQVANLVLFLASEAAGHITGTEVWIDGGQSLLQG